MSGVGGGSALPPPPWVAVTGAGGGRCGVAAASGGGCGSAGGVSGGKGGVSIGGARPSSDAAAVSSVGVWSCVSASAVVLSVWVVELRREILVSICLHLLRPLY